jgi:hypothetical protein
MLLKVRKNLDTTRRSGVGVHPRQSQDLGCQTGLLDTAQTGKKANMSCRYGVSAAFGAKDAKEKLDASSDRVDW